MKIKNKLSLLISLIVAVAFTFAVIVQQYAFSIYDEQLYLKSSQVLHLSSSAIEAELERIEQLSLISLPIPRSRIYYVPSPEANPTMTGSSSGSIWWTAS